MVRKYVAETVYNAFVKPIVKTFTKKQKTTGEGAIKSVKPGTKLTQKRESQDKFVDFRTKLHTDAKFDTATKNKLKMKNPLTKINKQTSKIITPDEPKFNKGGRVEYKRGTGLMKKKSNVDKIKKTFGTLSVRAGIDNNPNPTYADKIAGAKMKNKKKKKFV
jgi:hypothetical protein